MVNVTFTKQTKTVKNTDITNMDNYIDVIGKMDNPNNIHLNIYDSMREYYSKIQELAKNELDSEKFSSNIEHTNIGLNLAFIIKDEKVTEKIEAICKYANLEKRKVINSDNSKIIRFKL